MRRLATLAIATTVLGVLTAPLWQEKPEPNPKPKKGLLAEKIERCDGVVGTEEIGSRTQARINLLLDPSVPIEEVARCVRVKVKEVGLVGTSVLSGCISRPNVEVSTGEPSTIAVGFSDSTCYPSR